MAEEKNSSKKNKTSHDNSNDLKKKTKENENKKLDTYDLILLDTFPASDAVAKY